MLQVTVYLDGHPIPQTPFGVKVGPATLHAPACAVRGLADACPHGMLEFEVHGRDAFGNSLQLLPRCAWALSHSRHTPRRATWASRPDVTTGHAFSLISTPPNAVGVTPAMALGATHSDGRRCLTIFVEGRESCRVDHVKHTQHMQDAGSVCGAQGMLGGCGDGAVGGGLSHHRARQCEERRQVPA